MNLENLKFRAWDKRTKLMNEVTVIDFENEEDYYKHWRYGHSEAIAFNDIELLQSTGLKDKNDVEIFEGDKLKDQMDYGTDGSVNYVATVRYDRSDGRCRGEE